MSAGTSHTHWELLGKLSGEQRVQLALALTTTCFTITRAGIRAQHPDATPETVERELRRRLGYRIDDSRRAHPSGS